MVKKLLFSIALSSSLMSTGYGAVNYLTHHSRANCGNFNETVSWDGVQTYKMGTVSIHTNRIFHGKSHVRESWISLKHRAAAYDVGDNFGDIEHMMHVEGYHYMMADGEAILIERTSADDCNIYDGWWAFDED